MHLPTNKTLSSLFFLFFFFIGFLSFSQNSKMVWENLLQNNREKALSMVEKSNSDNSIESFILRQIVRRENGIMLPKDNFIEKFTSYPEYENYLFAQWNMPYFFSEYLDTGFFSTNIEAVQKISEEKIQNSTIKNALLYLKAVVARHQNNWDLYTEYNNKIDAIKKWEFCGSFENLNNSGLVTPYEPENYAVSKKGFDARSIGLVNWFETEGNVEPYQFFSNQIEYGSGINYAQTFLESPEEQRVHLKIGRGGVIRVWVNDVLLIENDKDVISEMDAFTYAINLQEGINRILIKSASKSTPYFIVRIEDEKGNPVANLKNSLNNKDYKNGTEVSLNAKKIPHPVISYFKKLQNEKGVDENLAKFNLYLSYMRISDYENAKSIIVDWLKEYPESSLLKSCLASCYVVAGDLTTKDEIFKNIELSDPNYYVSLFSKFQDYNKLLKLDITTYEDNLHTIGKAMDYPFMKTVTDLLIDLRKENLDSLEYSLDKLLSSPLTPSTMKPTFVNFYSEILNDDSKTISALENILSKTFDYECVTSLSYYYQKQNRIDESLQVFENIWNHLNYDNNYIYDYILKLHEFNKYEESLPYIEKGLKNFPNSFAFLKLKGDAYRRLNKIKEAISFYEQAIERNSSNSQLRKTIYDLKKIQDPLEKIDTRDEYDYVAENRNKIKNNNYGLNILLDQTDVLKYETGGGRLIENIIYEVTSQKGIEMVKEYNLGLSGNYSISKSEIIKPNKSIVPAERSGSKLVFNGLSIGDVVYISYEKNYVSSGRFCEDYVDIKSFSSYHPVLKNNYRLLTSKENVHFKITNGDIPLKKYKIGAYQVYEWDYTNINGMPMPEDYMPPFSDVAEKLHISTIGSWSDIANWYSDLVRSQIQFDDTVLQAFNELFPKGYKDLSENERANRIYNYITANFSYSYVSFKQSGYVPQKPAKTIKTKLGDCKDFSTLFVALARKAELDAKLVLILTSDYGEKALLMPSSDFNHCIVKVIIDQNPQYLELTDKYLPYKSLPISLHNATALEIPYNFDKEENNTIYSLDNISRNIANLRTKVYMNVDENESKLKVTTEVSGHLAAYYIEMMQADNEDVLEEDVYDELSNRTTQDITLLNVHDINIDSTSGDVVYTSDLILNEKINNIGALKTFQLPYFSNPYNQDIISLEERKYPIDYKLYENTDKYEDEFIIKLKEGSKFIEIPESKEFHFEDHYYAVTYDKISDNELKVNIEAKPGSVKITPENYKDFKSYVKEVLDTRKQFFAYK